MADRETREFVTPGGHQIILNAYLTGREANDIKAIMFSALSMNMGDARESKVNIGNVPGTFLIEQERKALGFLLVSVDGDVTNPVDQLLDLPATEYDAVIKEVNAIQNPTMPQNSEQPGDGTSAAA
jgi:hypothetical protein